MLYRGFIALMALAAAALSTMTGALAFDESKYPLRRGQLIRAHSR
jgi:hypothetical protein